LIDVKLASVRFSAHPVRGARCELRHSPSEAAIDRGRWRSARRTRRRARRREQSLIGVNRRQRSGADNERVIELEIDGRRVQAGADRLLIDAAASAGIAIPSLCHHRELRPTANCRLCMVEIEGWRVEAPACSTRVEAGMRVHTESPRIAESRRAALELVLARYHDPQWGRHARPENEFEYWCRHYGVRVPDSVFEPGAEPRDADPHPLIRVDLDRCILCTRCVRACKELQVRCVWGLAGRGDRTHLAAGLGTAMLEARCESCGACAAFCPTGALEDRAAETAGRPDALVTTVCPYCGVGCSYDLGVKDGRVVRVFSNPYAPVNGMHLCVKGRYGWDFVQHAERLTQPTVRRELLEGRARGPDEARGEWVSVDWDTALDLVAVKLETMRQQTGPDAIAFLASAKCTNEENYLIQKLARQVIGTHNVDHCARLCHASTVAGLLLALGSGAMSNTMADIAGEARALFVIGSNTTEQHPVFGSMLRRAAERGTKIVVADPRRIDLCEFATLHLRQRPGTDIALVNGLLHLIFANGWEDRSFIDARTEGVDALRVLVQRYPPERVAEITGVAAAELAAAAELLARERPMAVVWAMGITQHTTGVSNVLALANLQLALGNFGVPGAGVNPLRGQNNVQGACDMGGLPNVFPGYQPVGDAAARGRFARGWALSDDGPAIGERPGLTVTEMIGAAGARKLRALFIVGENPAMTDPDLNHVRRSLGAAEFVVLQEILPSATAEFADVLLPAAAWAEKDGTFTNTERRVQRVREAVEPPGAARPDWAIVADLATRLLERQGRAPKGPQAGWHYASPAEVLDEIAALTPSYAGIDVHRLERGETLHWPVPTNDHPGTPILHRECFTRGKGAFHAVDHSEAAELPDAEFPLLLTTGRVLVHWHGGEMTRRSAVGTLCPEPEIEIHPSDARAIGLANSEAAPLRLVSRRGQLHARAWVTDRVPEGVVFGNFHFPDEGNVNNLTLTAVDPVAKIPEYKVCAVRAEPATA
jgi:formate dehydrogenase alpha subunit